MAITQLLNIYINIYRNSLSHIIELLFLPPVSFFVHLG